MSTCFGHSYDQESTGQMLFNLIQPEGGGGGGGGVPPAGFCLAVTKQLVVGQ